MDSNRLTDNNRPTVKVTENNRLITHLWDYSIEHLPNLVRRHYSLDVGK